MVIEDHAPLRLAFRRWHHRLPTRAVRSHLPRPTEIPRSRPRQYGVVYVVTVGDNADVRVALILDLDLHCFSPCVGAAVDAAGEPKCVPANSACHGSLGQAASRYARRPVRARHRPPRAHTRECSRAARRQARRPVGAQPQPEPRTLTARPMDLTSERSEDGCMTAVPLYSLRDDTMVNRIKPLKSFEGDT